MADRSNRKRREQAHRNIMNQIDLSYQEEPRSWGQSAPMPGYDYPGTPGRDPFAPPVQAWDRLQPQAPRQGLLPQPRDAQGSPIAEQILQQMDRVRAAAAAGQLMTGGQEAENEWARRGGRTRKGPWA